MAPLGVGVPVAKTASLGWDWWPVLGIAVALVITLHVLGLRLGPPVLLAVAATGLVYSPAVHTWGVLPPLGLAVVVALVALLMRHRTSRDTDPPV